MRFHAAYRVVFVAAVSALAPALADAARISVRPIPAPNATEIAIETGGAAFAIERMAPQQVDLVLDAPSAEFDLAAMERTSLAPLISGVREVPEEGRSRLRFVLACPCSYEFGVEDGVLRMRVMQPTDPDRRPDFERAALLKPPEKLTLLLPQDRDVAAADPIEAEGTTRTAGASRLTSATGRAAPKFAPPPRERGGAEIGPAGTGLSGTTPVDVEVGLAKQHLLRQLSRAAEQGLVDFASADSADLLPSPEEADERRPKSRVEAETPSPATDQEPAETQYHRPEPRPGLPASLVEIPLRARTAQDRDFDPTRRETMIQVAPCLDATTLDLSTWVTGMTFAEAVAFNRSRLVDEYDDPAPDAVLDLARAYLVNGFGAEALRLLDIYGAAVKERELLADLARVVDGRLASPHGPIAATAPCSGEATLWRRAAGAPPAPGAEEQNDALIDAFGRLPRPVRFAIAPQLIANLVDLGNIGLAQRVDLTLSRSPSMNEIALDFARARLLQASGKLEAAETLYARLARRKHPATEEALILLANSLIDRGADIPQELTDALTVSGRLARGGPNETALKVAEARARARSESLGSSLESLSAAMARRPSDAPLLRDAAHAVLEDAKAEASGALAYSKAVFEHADLISQRADGDAARRRVAEELNKVGLPNAALEIVGPALDRAAAPARRVAARAYLSLAAPEDALIILEGLDDAAAKQLRAEAYEQLGRLDDAVKAIADVAAPKEAASMALRAGDWDRAAETENREARLLSQFMADRGQAKTMAPEALDDEGRTFLEASPPTGAVTLSQAVEAMDASRAVRTVVTEALEDG